jgi:hypothetical protein
VSRTRRIAFSTLLAAFSGIASAQIQVQLPVSPMTASTSPSISVALTETEQALFFTVNFSGLPAGLTLKNQSYTGWCPDYFGDFNQNNNSTPYTPYNTYGNNLPGNAQSPNWDKVNWVLNHQPTGSQASWIVQQVIWRLLAGQYAPVSQGYVLPEPATDNLYNQAIAQGAGFLPSPGQLMAVMLYIDGIYPSAPADVTANPNLPTNGTPNVFQDLMIEVTVPPQGAIGDYVWQDTNQNGIQDAGEPGINGVTVQLCADAGCSTVLATTTTVTHQGLNGYYQFTDLGAGTYYVSIDNSQPTLSGLVPTQTGQGTPATDSNVNPSQVVLATNTSVDETIDFGYTSPGTSAIGDFVWNDSNGNGLQDSGEPGISGVKVNLCQDAACSTIIATTTTDQNGAYHFTGLLAGTYYVVVDTTTLPPGFIASPSQVGFPGNAAIDSNGSPAQVVLPENFTDNTIDFGFVPPAQGAIGDFVWHDLNRNGIQDNDSNNNPEPGINSVTVRLYNSSNTLVGTTTTVTANGHDGYYQFTGLAAGTYTVVLDSNTLPPGYTSTTSNAPGSTTANDSNGSPATVTLATNSSVDETIDFGFVSPCVGAIGDFVWNDANQNGIQDANELGIPGVAVYLRAADNSLVGSTTTDQNGAYHFTGLCAATYTVQVVTPAGFQPSPSTAPGSTPANDSNGSPATVVLGIDATDNTIDFGFYQPLSVNGQCLAGVNSGEVGVPFNSSTPTVTGGTGPYTFSIATGTLPAGLTLDSTTGIITGTPTAAGNFTLQVTDSNNFVIALPCPYTVVPAPTVTCSAVTSGEVGVPFNSPGPSVTGGVAPYTYTVVGTLPSGLILNAQTGAITGMATAAGTFTLQVTDANGVVAATTCPYTIVGVPTVTCAAVTSGEVGVPFSSGAMTVSGGVAPYTYTVVGTLPMGLTLNPSNGAITGTPTAAGTFTVQVSDANGVLASTTCPFTIVSPPTVTCSAVGTGEVGVPFNSPAMTVSGGASPYTFTVVGTLPAGLTLNASTGAITGTPTAAGTFSIQVRDANGVVAGGTCPFTILSAPSLSHARCGSVTSGEVGLPFNSPAQTVTGGVAPYTFTIATGSLPAGLTLNASNGAITGTPTAAGSFTIQVTDADGVVASGTCPFAVVAAPSVTCSAVNSGEVGVPFNSPAPTVTGGTSPYTFTVVGALPSGLTLNTSTGAITGTPTAAGSFTIQVRDANGVAAATTCPYTIVAGPTITCSAVNSGEVGVPFNSPAPTVTGGVAPYTFTVATGTLPGGLTLNASTGAITGTPTAAGAFSIKVRDANGVVATTTCPYTIVPGLSVTCSSTNTGTVGVAFNSGAIRVTSGVAPYTFSIGSGTLPSGLILNTSTGAVTGTPTASGTFTIQVKDANGAVGSACSITINPGVMVTCGANNTGTVGVPFNSGPITVTGGNGPYTFTVVGNLPRGLYLNPSTGAVTGTPTETGTFSIQATDSQGHVGSCRDSQGNPVGTSCTITINPAPLTVTCGTTATGIVGVAFNSGSIKVTGGSSPYTFSVVGTLPAGLTLNKYTGAVTGTPKATGTFTIKVTDANGNTSSSCSITINPGVTVTCGTNSTGTVGVPFNSGPITVSGGAGGPYTFTVVGKLPAGLTLNTSTGAVTGTPTQTGTFSIQATDSQGNVGSCSDSHGNPVGTSCTITINPAPVTVTCGANNVGTVGVAFNSGPITVTGGTGPYTFTVVGTLPHGLTLNTSTGAVTGTPTQPGTFSIQATDSQGHVGSCQDSHGNPVGNSCAITINPAPISVSCGNTTTGTVGTYFNSGSVTVTGGVAPYTFSVVGTLPNGLSLNSSTGAVTGTPTAAGTFSVAVTDSKGTTGTSCSITITPPQNPHVTCGTNNTGTVGVAFSSGPVNVTGGAGGPYTFTVVGTLPHGLTLNTSTGAVTGTPTQPGTFSIQATDSKGNVGSCQDSHGNPVGNSCSITISPAPLTVTCGTNNTGTVGTYFNSGSITVTGGVPSYTFKVVGTLPSGLTLNSSTGAVTGTPTAAGTFSISVTDSAGNTAGTSCSITITPAQNPHVVVTCGTNNTGTVGVAFSSGPINVSGGTGPYTFTVVGSLPHGLTLNTSTGAVTGTPTQSGTFSIQATDSKGNVGSCQDSHGNPVGNSCSITISPAAVPPVTVTCGANNTGTVGVAFNSGPITITGGVAPYTFTVVGNLPNGLYLNSSTGAVTGTPTQSGTFSIQAVDSKGNVGSCSDSNGNPVGSACSITINAASNSNTVVSPGDAATIGFWHNQNGQALIDSLNGGENSHALANLLASQAPYLYGPKSSNDLTGGDNGDVAALFLTFFNQSGQKTQAQIMATVLACYVTSSTLAGTNAVQYGFNSSSNGTCTQTYNVGSSGSAIGLNNNQSYTVLQLLQLANQETANGTFNADANTFNTIFSGINQTGDIN